MLDAHQKPPDFLKDIYKKYQKQKGEALDQDKNIIDFSRGLSSTQKSVFEVKEWMSVEAAQTVFNTFTGSNQNHIFPERIVAYHSLDLPGAWRKSHQPRINIHP